MGQQIWAVSSLGGYLSNNVLSKQIRQAAQPIMKFRQFVDAEGAAGRNRGDKVLFDKISNISAAGGTIAETSTIPKRNYTIVQGSMQVNEYGNAIPYTMKAATLADVSVPDIVKTVLRNDLAKVLDSAVATELKCTYYKAACINTATTSTATASALAYTASANMSDKNVRDCIDFMKRLNTPRYDGANYICIASTNMIRGLYDFFESKIIQTSAKPMFNGEVGQYYGCRFVEETNVLRNTLGSGAVLGEAMFLGGDACREAIVIPEDIRIDLPKDFGRDQAIAWYYMGGFKLVWGSGSADELHVLHLTDTAGES